MAASFEDLQSRDSKDFGMESYRKTLDDSYVQELASALVPHVARRMGRREEELRRCLESIGLDDTLQLSGLTMSEDNWQTFEIKLSTGLLLFHYKMVKLFVSRMTVVGDGNKVVDETRFSDDEMLSTAKRLMQAFWEEEVSREHFFRVPGFSLLRQTKSQIELSAQFLIYAERFVVAHEFGHILLNAAPDRVKREMRIIEGATESMVQPVLNEQERHGNTAILQNWMEEITADFIGVSLCQELKTNDVAQMVIHSSAMMSLVMCDMLDRYYRKLTGTSWEYRTHPPSYLRLDVLQTLSDWPAGLDMGTSFRQFSDYVMAKI